MFRSECTVALHTVHEAWVERLYTGVFHAAFPILIVVGTIANLTNLVVLTRPAMRSRTYRWLRVLAVVDLALCVLMVPVCVVTSGHGPSPSYLAARYYAHFGWSLSIGAQVLSFYLMGWFALERYLAVCRHHQYAASQTDRFFRRCLAGTVTFVLVLYIPTMAVGVVCDSKDKEGVWVPLDGYSRSSTETASSYVGYTWVRELCSRVVPAVALTVCNVSIALHLRHLRNIRDGFGSGVSPARKERERRLVLLLFWVTALFYVFNAPVMVYYLGFLNHSHLYDQSSLLAFAALSNFFQMAGNTSNFLLYFLINPEFRRTLRGVIRSLLRITSEDPRGPNAETLTTSSTSTALNTLTTDTITTTASSLTATVMTTTTAAKNTTPSTPHSINNNNH